MNIIPVSFKIKVPYEDYQKILEFMNESSSSHASRDRSPDEKNRHIVTGKIAEKGFELMCISQGIPVTPTLMVNSIYGDGGKDFVVYGKTVDVKSISNRFSSQVITGRKLESEVYVLCLVEGFTVTYLGMISRDEILERKLLRMGESRNGNTYYYVDKSHLKQFNEIFEDK